MNVYNTILTLFISVLFVSCIIYVILFDQANVHSIVSSEDHVLQLMQLIDEAVKEVTLIEERLSSYDQVIAVSYLPYY